MTKIYLKPASSLRGGPSVWNGRFRQVLESRGYAVIHDLDKDWSAALFVADSEGIEKALHKGRAVAYRVANAYLPEWFQTMGLRMETLHHSANATIAKALQAAEVVIYQSKWAKEQLDRSLYSRLDDFSIIHNGVNLRQFFPSDRLGENEMPTIGTAGKLRYRYRLETFLEMSLRLDFPHKLLIVGSMDRECREVLQRFKKDSIVGPRISYLGFVSPENMPAIYSQMDLLVHPVCGDACPNVVAEALASGIPVIAPRPGGTAELVEESGVIFDCAIWEYNTHFVDSMVEAVSEALNNLAELSVRAREQAEAKLDVELMTDRYLEALGLSAYPPKNKRIIQSSNLSWRAKASQAVARPRYFTALALRKFQSASRNWQPRRANQLPRIAFTLFDFHVGGIENWLYRLAHQLQEEFDFYFLATRVWEALPKFHEVGKFAYLPNPTQMSRFLANNNIDIVQVHNERWPIDSALAAGVTHIIERTNGTRSCARVPKYGLSLVIASSEGTIPMIARRIPRDKIHLIYNGIDLEEVDAAETRRLWSEDCFVIGRASRFGRGKNLGLLIEAMQQLHQRHEHIRLVLIGGDSRLPGSEPMEAELRAEAVSLGEAVAFPGHQENAIPWVKGFDVGTCVSNPENEGIPNSLIEAMACRKAVISSDVDQVSELIQHGVNGLLFPPGDLKSLVSALEKLIHNPALAQSLGEAGRNTIEKRFNLQKSADQYAKIYWQLLGSRA